MQVAEPKQSRTGLSVGAAVGVVVLVVLVYARHSQADGAIFLRTTMPVESIQAPFSKEVTSQSNTIVQAELRLIERLYETGREVGGDVVQNDERWRIVKMRVTAYCPCSICCGEFSDGITACNHRIQPGDVFVAADKVYRFGTNMLVPGYNNNQPVQVLDRGCAIKGNRLDVFFPTHLAAQKWGVRYLDVLVLDN